MDWNSVPPERKGPGGLFLSGRETVKFKPAGRSSGDGEEGRARCDRISVRDRTHKPRSLPPGACCGSVRPWEFHGQWEESLMGRLKRNVTEEGRG